MLLRYAVELKLSSGTGVAVCCGAEVVVWTAGVAVCCGAEVVVWTAGVVRYGAWQVSLV